MRRAKMVFKQCSMCGYIYEFEPRAWAKLERVKLYHKDEAGRRCGIMADTPMAAPMQRMEGQK